MLRKRKLVLVGNGTALVPVCGGPSATTHAVIDEADAADVGRFNWRFNGRGYVCRSVRIGGFRKTIALHRQLLGVTKYSQQVDHIDGDPLNNRRANLRVCTNAENSRNRTRLRRDNTSGVCGVTWYSKKRKWGAGIRLNGRRKHLGLYTTLEAASRARREAAIKYFGSFAGSLDRHEPDDPPELTGLS